MLCEVQCDPLGDPQNYKDCSVLGLVEFLVETEIRADWEEEGQLN